MVKFLRTGKVVVLLNGRFAGKKAVIVHNHDQGTNDRPFGHAVVAGVERHPLKVTKKMNAKKIAKRSRIKPFVKAINYTHIMPTRYMLDMSEGLRNAVPAGGALNNPTTRKKAKVALNKLFMEKYTAGKNSWFFARKLRF